MRFLSLQWMKHVMARLAEMTEDQIYKPESELQFDDEILVAGKQVDLELRKLYTLAVEKDKEAARAIVAASAAVDPEQREKLAKEASTAGEDAGLLLTVFLETLREQHGVAKSANVTVRKEWAVVRKAQRAVEIASPSTMRREIARHRLSGMLI